MPQQMKKKKKAGGYNLRKSLAWNKAFFTEEGFYVLLLNGFVLFRISFFCKFNSKTLIELYILSSGVLDSVELSMITGSTSTSCVEALGAIDEEIPAESSGGCYKDLSLKDKLFKDMSISTPSAGRKNGRCLMPKRGSSTKDNVSQLLQSVHFQV